MRKNYEIELRALTVSRLFGYFYAEQKFYDKIHSMLLLDIFRVINIY